MSEKDAMDQPPIPDERILEALEACRPGSDDLNDPALAYLAAELAANPELRNLYDRLQAVDAKLAAGFRDVPVPEGLHQRLIDRLAAGRAEHVAPSHQERAAETAATVVRRLRHSRRRWLLAAGGMLSAAAVLLIAAWIHPYGSDTYAEQDVLGYASKLFNGEEPAPGRLLVEESPPKAYPISPAVLRVPRTKWRRLSDFLGRSGVAYDIPGRGGTQATLYVTRRAVAGLPERPPTRPGSTTAGCSASAWQEGELLCVLVVHGNSRTYRSFLATRGPLT